MNWDAIGAIGELVGGAAVLVTLIYLAVQIRQANSAGSASPFGDMSQSRTTTSLNHRGTQSS
jgi:hypothetical protein